MLADQSLQVEAWQSIHHARSLIRQRHIRASSQMINIPFVLVRIDSEKHDDSTLSRPSPPRGDRARLTMRFQTERRKFRLDEQALLNMRVCLHDDLSRGGDMAWDLPSILAMTSLPLFGRTNGSSSDDKSMSWNAWRLPWRVTTGPGFEPHRLGNPRLHTGGETSLRVHVVTMLLTEDGWTMVISDKCVTTSAIKLPNSVTASDLLASKLVGTRLDGPPTTTSRRWGRVWASEGQEHVDLEMSSLASRLPVSWSLAGRRPRQSAWPGATPAPKHRVRPAMC